MTRTSTLKDELSYKILSDIMDGAYNTDEILSESEMMNRYNSSKSTAREALIKLCQENVLESIPRKGYRIKPLSFKDVFQIIEMRNLMESFALRKAFPLITPAYLDKMEQYEQSCTEDIKNSGDNYAFSKYWNNNLGFHKLLAHNCDNEYIVNMICEMITHCSRYVPQYYNSAWSHQRELMSGEIHQQIIDALRSQDFSAAVSLLEKDILSFKEELLAYLVNNA